MHGSRGSKIAAWTAAASLTLSAAGQAQMTPVKDSRVLEAFARSGNDENMQTFTPGFFAPMDLVLTAEAFATPQTGYTVASAYQNSYFTPDNIFYSGSTSGSWQVVPGSYFALSLALLEVRMDSCLEFNLYTQMDPGDDVGAPSGFVEIRNSGLTWFRTESGDSLMSGRLGPGTYTFEGKSSVATSVESLQGATYAMSWWCTPCASPLIANQPQDQVIACPSDVTLCVTTSVPAGGLTFQWRRNLVPLANGGNISGANGPCLAIQNACEPDFGYYDVVVTSGSLSEPSRMAHVGVGGTTGIDPISGPSANTFVLGPATPNPTRGDVQCRFSAPQPFTASVQIYDAAGRLVRDLEPRLFSGSGSVSWDGRTDAGALARAGLYFVRVAHPEASRFQRVAIVR